MCPIERDKFSAEIEKFIKVEPLTEDSWQVVIALPTGNVSSGALRKILRVAKEKISSQYELPIGLLAYEDLIHNKESSKHTNISARFIRIQAEKGDPQIRFENMTCDRGIEYEDMNLLLDLYPIKDNEEFIKIDDVWNLLRKNEISENVVEKNKITQAVEFVQTRFQPVKNFSIAKGVLPYSGTDANISPMVELNPFGENNLVGKDQLIAGSVICRRIPPVEVMTMGRSIKGRIYIPGPLNDLELRAGMGTELRNDGQEARALRKGIPRITIQKSPESSRLDIYSVTVDQVEEIDGTNPIEITTDSHVRIKGGVKSGSKIISQGEVFVSGDVEENTSIMTTGNLYVIGEVKGSVQFSESDIFEERSVFSSKLIAQGKLTIKGAATNSELTGNEVILDEVIGCRITVGDKADIHKISADENGFTAFIIAGRLSMLKKTVEENEKFIDNSKKNLKKIAKVLGSEIIDEASPANVSRMMMIHVRNLKQAGIISIPRSEKETIIKLLATIGPIREMIDDKTYSNEKFKRKMSENDNGQPEIIIHTPLEAPVEVLLSGKTTKLMPEDGALNLKETDGKLVKKPLIV